METTTSIDLDQVAKELGLRLPQVATVVELIDEGNTVPFITRYRKDRTGGLDEEQIRQIEERVNRLRLLAERKQTILRSIDSQGKLTPELHRAIADADSFKRLEDLYVPYKPKRQTLATLARERGLEPLADEIFQQTVSAENLLTRAADFVNPDRQVPTAADALLGAGHILAERFAERAELRGKLREILERTGQMVTSFVRKEKEPSAPDKPADVTSPTKTAKPAEASVVEAPTGGDDAGPSAPSPAKADAPVGEANPTGEATAQEVPTEATPTEVDTVAEQPAASAPAEPIRVEETVAEVQTPPADDTASSGGAGPVVEEKAVSSAEGDAGDAGEATPAESAAENKTVAENESVSRHRISRHRVSRHRVSRHRVSRH